jgi:hypothetical protein
MCFFCFSRGFCLYDDYVNTNGLFRAMVLNEQGISDSQATESSKDSPQKVVSIKTLYRGKYIYRPRIVGPQRLNTKII